MAQHIPIGTAGFQVIVDKHFRPLHFNRLNDYQTEYFEKFGMHVQRLPLEYEMNEYHGKVDKYIFNMFGSFIYGERDDENYEVHLDKDWKVNQVYLVV